MKKAELEAAAAAYEQGVRSAHEYQRSGLYKLALEAAVGTWEHVDGMLQFESRFEKKETQSIAAIDLVLLYAPLLLDHKMLSSLEDFCKKCRRIIKNEAFDVTNRVNEARQYMRENHRLWSHLSEAGESLQSDLRKVLGGDQDRWRAVAEAWEKMGLIRRTPQQNSYMLRLATSMGQVVPAKCPKCGRREQAPKAMFLDKVKCPKCRARDLFVFCA